MKYFEGLTEEKAIKDRYRKLAKEHHPDRGGCSETMKAVSAQYEEVLTGHYQRTGKSITEIDELLGKDFAVAQKLREIILVDGIDVELCGCWIWLSGKTKEVRDKLKSCGFSWSNTKKMWYWRPGDQKYKRWGKQYSMDDIRLRHGSTSLSARRHEAIA